MADVCMATWARSRPDALTITGREIRAQTVRVRPPRGQPGQEMLVGTGWHGYPGSQWKPAEFADGVWECAVFAFPGNGTVALRLLAHG